MARLTKFQKTLKEMAAWLASPDGLATIPIDNEALRPLLALFEDVAERYGPLDSVVAFDFETGDQVERIFLGAPVYVTKLNDVQRDFGAQIHAALEVLPAGTRLQCNQVGPELALLYSTSLFVPVAALGARRH